MTKEPVARGIGGKDHALRGGRAGLLGTGIAELAVGLFDVLLKTRAATPHGRQNVQAGCCRAHRRSNLVLCPRLCPRRTWRGIASRFGMLPTRHFARSRRGLPGRRIANLPDAKRSLTG